jgi:CarD family transcriptional regulator
MGEAYEYRKNDYLIHKDSGVCVVEDVGFTQISPSHKEYYTLRPLGEEKYKVYVPIDNTQCIVRRVLTKQQALELLERIEGIEAIPVDDEKKCKDAYNSALRDNNSHDWIGLIKTLIIRAGQRQEQGKTVSNVDERYLKKVTGLLFDELSVALDISKEQAQTCVTERILI